MSEQYSGFEEPKANFTRVPNDFLEAMHIIDTVGEMKVVYYILRHTWGFQDDQKKITLDEFEHGRKRRDGTRLDSGTGLSKPTIINGLKRAEQHGFIIVGKDDSDGGRVKKFYSLKMRKELDPRGKESLQENDDRGKESLHRTEKDTTTKKDTLETESPTATETTKQEIPSTFQEWLAVFRDPSTNKPAALRKMYQTLYPEHPPPDYGYCGKVARRVGGYEVLAMRLWELSTKPPVGDVLAYVQGIKKGGNGKSLRNKEIITSWMEGWQTVDAEWEVI